MRLKGDLQPATGFFGSPLAGFWALNRIYFQAAHSLLGDMPGIGPEFSNGILQT